MQAPPKLLLAIVALSLVTAAGTVTSGHQWGDDFAAYIMQGQSIMNGTTDEFLKRNSFTILKSSFQIGPVAYPWGFPLILVPALVANGLHPLTLKVPGILCFVGFLVCLHGMAAGRLPRTESLLLVSLFAFSPVVTGYLDHILSDIPFLFVTFLALAWMARRQQMVWSSAGLGVVVFLAFFVRATGIILLATFLADQALLWWRGREARRDVLVHAGVVVGSFVLPWMLARLVLPHGVISYFGHLNWRTARVLRGNPSYYVSLFGEFLGGGPLSNAVFLVLLVLFVMGLWRRSQADQPVAIFFVAYLAAMLCWPERQGVRFIFPILPVFAYMAFQGARSVIEFLPEERQRAGTVAFKGFWLLLVGSFWFGSAARAYETVRGGAPTDGPFEPRSSAVFDYIKAETPADSVIVFFKPRAMRLLTDRDSVMIATCEGLPIGDYVVVSKKPEIGQVQPDRIGQCGLTLEAVFENEGFLVYQLRPGVPQK